MANELAGADVVPGVSSPSAQSREAIDQWMRTSISALIGLIEQVAPGMRGSVLLLDDDGITLRHAAAPSLPDAYCRLIDGERIGPAAGSCGTAVYRRERVIVRNIATDPLWADYRRAAEPFGLAACWSTPIRDSGGDILGTFAMYYDEPREPGDADIALTETATMLSANIIQRARVAQALRARTESAEQFAMVLRQREEELRLSHARLRAALDASATSTWEWDMRTGVVDCDEGLYRLFGVDPAAGAGSFDRFVARIHADDRDRVIAAAQRCASEGVDLDEEFRTVMPDASTRWLVDRGRAVLGDDGRPRYLIGACVDVTERRTREDQFRALAESIPQLAWMADATGSIYWYNQRWYDYTGTTLEEMRGWGWTAVHHPDHVDGVARRIQHSWDTGEPWEDTFPLRGRDGRYRWFLSRAQPIRDADGKIARWFGTNTDITERLEAEQAVRASEAKLRRIADSGIVGVFYWTLAGAITDANAEFRRMLGLSEEALRAGTVSWRALTPPEWAAVDAVKVGELNAQGVTVNWEKEFVAADGGRVPVLLGAAFLDGSADRGIAVCLDITERRRAEAERERLLEREREARAAAERASRIRDDVMAVVAHDLRNPVHTIILSAGMLRELPLDEAQRERRLAVIQRTAKTMETLIRDLLDATRIESGTFAVRQGRVHVPALLDETLELFEAPARERLITLRCEADDDLPPALGDRERLEQVLSNLIGNALKFTQAGGQVTMRARTIDRGAAGSPADASGMPADRAIEVCVADTGGGIPPEQLEHVFDRYWQADRQGRAGAGLGLSIVKGIVEAHEGGIRVESVVGEGTTFSFTIPVAPPSHAGTRRASSRIERRDET
jgi:PAS domain S-box-containing protein